MKLKGNMVIELVDGNTGEEERIEEGNMVTNAVNDILGLNPMGIFYAVFMQILGKVSSKYKISVVN